MDSYIIGSEVAPRDYLSGSVSARDIPLALIGKCCGNHLMCNEEKASILKEAIEHARKYYEGIKRGFYPNTQKMENWEKWFIKHGEFAFGDDEMLAMMYLYDFCDSGGCKNPRIVVYDLETPEIPAKDVSKITVGSNS